jgi:hypothetical protein
MQSFIRCLSLLGIPIQPLLMLLELFIVCQLHQTLGCVGCLLNGLDLCPDLPLSILIGLGFGEVLIDCILGQHLGYSQNGMLDFIT